MHQQRLHVIAAIVVCAATLTVASCAAASLPGPDGTSAGSRGTSTSDTSAAPADPPTDGGSHTVGDADGRIGTSATIGELAGTPAVANLDAAAWMQEHGSDFGLCQTYENESWHYELSTTPGGTCPAMLRDSSEG